MKRLLPPTWRRLNRLSTALLLLTLVATISAYAIHSATVQADTHIPAARHGTIPSAKVQSKMRYLRTVDFSKLPLMTPGGATSSQPHQFSSVHGPLTDAQHAAYERSLSHLPGIPHAVGQPLNGLQTPAPSFAYQNGYHSIPWRQYAHDGLNSSTGGAPGGVSLASNPAYVLVADGDALVVYDFSGHIVAGPVSTHSFFRSWWPQNTSFGVTSVLWDATRNHWIMVMNVVYFDPMTFQIIAGNYFIATSVGQDPLLNPATKWTITVLDIGFCGQPNQPQIGSDYWGLWLTCIQLGPNPGFNTNMVIEINKNVLYGIQNINNEAYFVQVFGPIPTGISCGSGCLQPAYNFVPAIEDGTPDAEYMVATDAGYGGPFSDLVTVAFTNTHAITQGQTPTATYVITQLATPYADPTSLSQPGNPGNQNGPLPGVAQVQYMSGDLFTAWTTAAHFNDDPSLHNGVYWLDETPQLTPLNPNNPGAQTVVSPIIRNVGIYGFVGYDTYTPSMTSSSAFDEALVMGISSPTMNPSLIYTARRADDAPNVMGIGGYGFVAHGITAIYDYGGGSTSCSLETNLTVRGLIWCTGQYGGSHSSSTQFGGFDTYTVGLATE